MTDRELKMYAERLNILREKKRLDEGRRRDDPALVIELLEEHLTAFEGLSVEVAHNPRTDLYAFYIEMDDPDKKTIVYNHDDDRFRVLSEYELIDGKGNGYFPPSARYISGGSWLNPLCAEQKENWDENLAELFSSVLTAEEYIKIEAYYQDHVTELPMFEVLENTLGAVEYGNVVRACQSKLLHEWLGEMKHHASEQARLKASDETIHYKDPVQLFLEDLPTSVLNHPAYETAAKELRREWWLLQEMDRENAPSVREIENRLTTSRRRLDTYNLEEHGLSRPNFLRLESDLNLKMQLRLTDTTETAEQIVPKLMRYAQGEIGRGEVQKYSLPALDFDIYEVRQSLPFNMDTVYYNGQTQKFCLGTHQEILETIREAVMESLVPMVEDAYRKRLQEYTKHPSFLVEELLDGVSEQTDAGGVEGYLDSRRGIDLMYVNVGDPYQTTFLFDARGEGRFFVGKWGDVIEEQEREYEQQREQSMNEKTPEESYSDISPRKPEEEIASTGNIEVIAPPAPIKSVLDEIDWPKPRSKGDEMRQNLARSIIEQMERGEAFWQRPWKAPDIGGMPYNGVSNRRYHGVNIAYLLDASIRRKFSDPRWMTFKQASDAGYHVNAGESGTRIEFYKEYDPSKTKDGKEKLENIIRELERNGASEEDIERAKDNQKIWIIKPYTVFNAAQISGIEPLATTVEGAREQEELLYNERAERIIKQCGVPIQHGQSYAAYNRSSDIIKMPNREWFNSDENYYSTLLHEIAHSTGHPTRLDRPMGNLFGTPEYAQEELRAEMASAFLVLDLQIVLREEDMKEHIEQHAAYTQNWLSSLKDDYKEFFRATRDATKIADYVIAYDISLDLERHADKASYPAIKAAERNKVKEQIIEESKPLIGGNAIVTSAEKGQNYAGEIVIVGVAHAVQKIAPERGIIHSLTKIDEVENLVNAGPNEKIHISYDKDGRGHIQTQNRNTPLENVVDRD